MRNSWVVNASPLILLAKVGRLDLLSDLTEKLVIPAAVAAGIAAAHAQAGLREVVRAEAEELSGLRDLVRRQGAARHFDYRADQVVELHLFLGHDGLGGGMDDGDLKVQLALEPDERDHDFGFHLDASLLHFGGGFKDGAGLHLGDLRVYDSETAAAEAEHRVELVEFLHALFDLRDRHAHLVAEILLRLVLVREELVQRRVEEPNGGWVALQRLEAANEVSLLVRQELGEDQRSKAIVKLSPSSISRGSVPLNAFIPATIFRGIPIPMCSR